MSLDVGYSYTSTTGTDLPFAESGPNTNTLLYNLGTTLQFTYVVLHRANTVAVNV